MTAPPVEPGPGSKGSAATEELATEAAVGSASPATGRSTRGPFPPVDGDRAIVLVHGAWVGEWSWLPVLPSLRASGRAVHAVSLTGHGARSSGSGPHVDLSAHVADVVAVIETLDLRRVTLVGHSYGGRVITRVGAEVADRLTAMVFLDAHAPVAGDPGQSAARREAAEANGGMLPFSFYAPPVTAADVGDLDWFQARVMPQSFACFTEDWVRPVPDGVRPTYIFASGYEPTRFADYAEAARAAAGWRYHELPGSHFLMFDHTDRVADLILTADDDGPAR